MVNEGQKLASTELNVRLYLSKDLSNRAIRQIKMQIDGFFVKLDRELNFN